MKIIKKHHSAGTKKALIVFNKQQQREVLLSYANHHSLPTSASLLLPLKPWLRKGSSTSFTLQPGARQQFVQQEGEAEQENPRD